MRGLTFAAAVAAALMAGAGAVEAEDAAGVATELFNAGRDLMRSGDYGTACPKLAESARLDAKVGTLARLAECEEHVGRTVSARARWEQAANLARSQQDTRLAHVESELARLDSMVPKLLFSVDGAAPPDLRIRIDELDVGLGSVNVALPVDPGPHHVAASAPGKLAWSVEVVAPPTGAVVPVHVPVLEDAPMLASPAPPAAVGPPAAVPSRTPWRTVGLITGAVGVVGLGVGTALALIAVHKNDESNQPGGCNANSQCPASAYALRNDARAAGDASTALFVTGSLVVAGGIVVWLAAPRETRHEGPTSLILAPVVGPHVASIGVGGVF